MERFTLKVSEKLHAVIKEKGKQQDAVDAAVEALLQQPDSLKLQLKKSSKPMTKQISFELSEELQKRLKGRSEKADSRHMLKLIRQALELYFPESASFKLFFSGFDEDLKEILKKRFRDQWTHDSTAIEGNTLTLGETSFILNEGLTISGKTVREHDEITGHAKAIEILYSLLSKKKLEDGDLFTLHRAVMINPPFDVDKPVGAWKKIDNGAYWSDEYILYPPPSQMSKLMKLWLQTYNETELPETQLEAVRIYACLHNTFAAIHPFFDGNGRIARLIANLPLLKGGFPPLIISNSERFKYLTLMKENKLESYENLELQGPQNEIEDFLYGQWKRSLEIIEQIRDIQKSRS